MSAVLAQVGPISERYDASRHPDDRPVTVGIGAVDVRGGDVYQRDNQQAVIDGFVRLTHRYALQAAYDKTIIGWLARRIEVLFVRSGAPSAVEKMGALATLAGGLEVRATLPRDVR